MMNYEEKFKQASIIYEEGLKRVESEPTPEKQFFARGSRVKICKNLGESMSHFPSDKLATVKYTYAHAYGGDNVKSYCLDIDGVGEVSWYLEGQLEKVEN